MDTSFMVQRIVFSLLFAVCIISFVKTLTPKMSWNNTRDRSLPFNRLGLRLWRVFSEILLQFRVIKARPVVGIMHAMVMWGFVVFSWVTVKHLRLGFVGLNRGTESLGWYELFVAIWAAAVTLGISGLTYRRFIMRPKVLGKLSKTSGLVAFLILLLMITYLLGYWVFKPASLGWQINWWLHTLGLFGMIIVIPKSKHLHLLLAPFSIFFKSETISGMRALNLEKEELGMVTFNDLSVLDVLQLNSCVECGRCTDACPVNTVGRSLDPKLVVLQMQHGKNAKGSIIAGTKQEVTDTQAWVTDTDLLQCLSCGACENVCPVGIEHVGKFLDLRRGLVSEGKVSNEKVVNLFTTMEQKQNPWGISQDVRRKLIAKEAFPIFTGEQTYLFWLGCGLSFDPHGQKVAKAMSKILTAAGVSWGVLKEESCCGEPARRAGNEALFLELSANLTEVFKRNKVKTIITCCPHCATMLDNDYRQLPDYRKLNITVLHHTELINSLLPHLELRPSDKIITYHDPCYLARTRKVTSQPRHILSACSNSKLIEMDRSKEQTFCCGAGGAQIFLADDRNDKLPRVNPVKSRKAGTAEQLFDRVNHERFHEAAATGADILAVACTYCPLMLQDAASHVQSDMEIMDVAEIVANQLKEVDHD